MTSFRQIALPLQVKPKRKKTSKSFTQFDLAQAKKLHSVLNPIGNWSSIKWAEEFRILRESLPTHEVEQRIEKAVDWLKPANAVKINAIKSAASFRRHFNWLEEIIAKDDLVCVDISPEAKTLAKTLRRLSWPQGSDELLEATVQLTYERFAKAFAVIFTLYQSRKREHGQLPSPKKTDRYLLLLEHLYRSRLSSPGHFTQRWMEDLHKQVAGWAGWNGDLISMAFKFDSPRFQRMLRGWTDEFGSETETWYTFWKEFCDASGAA